MAQAGWSDVEGLAQFLLNPVEGIKGIKALIDNPEARQKLGDALVNDANAKIERIQDALEHGGDDRAVQLGQDIGELVWQVGTIATGVGTAAKGGVTLAKAGIRVGAERLEKMADMAKIAKAEASAGKPMDWTSVEGAYSKKLEGGYGPGTTIVNGKVVENPADYSAGIKKPSKVLREVEINSGGKGAWSKELNKPEPNTIYRVDGNKIYQTDSLGRVEKVESELLLVKNDRNTYQQCVAGKCGVAGDEGGHLIASIFNGPGEKLNLLPMNGNLNKGEWKVMENTWASALKEGKSVSVKIEPVYTDAGLRPDRFNVRYSIDGGRPVIVDFKNTPKGGN
nr:DNA/RNA non-specific endonuclease [Pseudomonas sp. PICF6]